MTIVHINNLPTGQPIDADVLIIGGGACGLTVARELAGSGLRIVVVESGELAESEEYEALNQVELADGCFSDEEIDFRESCHSIHTEYWSGRLQPFGVRCRVFGGSTHAWAGKSAPFDAIDFDERDWMPGSGWPISRKELQPYIDKAATILDLGPARFDAGMWEVLGRSAPKPELETEVFRSFFWHFARSTLSASDVMRFGPEFRANAVPDVQVILGGTVTNTITDQEGGRFKGVEIASLSGSSRTLHAKAGVLSAGAIENARLLLASTDAHALGLGNREGQVGRNLIDHPMALVARFGPDFAREIALRFGFFGFHSGRRSHLAMHGLALTEAYQRQHRSPNGALYMAEDRAVDDPFSALSRILHRRSGNPMRDLVHVMRSPVRFGLGLGIGLVRHKATPPRVSNAIVNAAIRFFPNTVANEFRYGKLPYKLTGFRVEAIAEQAPCEANKVELSQKTDRFGMPLARVHWRAGPQERECLVRQGHMLVEQLSKSGIPAPELEPWVADNRPEDGVVIDLGHPMGTTRMSPDPARGVVNPDLRLHDVKGLYCVGGSVFPTSGHANPTLMMLALSVRLAEHLRVELKTA